MARRTLTPQQTMLQTLKTMMGQTAAITAGWWVGAVGVDGPANVSTATKDALLGALAQRLVDQGFRPTAMQHGNRDGLWIVSVR
jgi:hypothetical protein